jgi:hypothetical protein
MKNADVRNDKGGFCVGAAIGATAVSEQPLNRAFRTLKLKICTFTLTAGAGALLRSSRFPWP